MVVEELDGAQSGIEFLAATVASPNGHILARQLDLPVHANRSVLVTGPNGSGELELSVTLCKALCIGMLNSVSKLHRGMWQPQR